MSQITTCPHCSKRLRVSEQLTDKTLICPHCLAEVDNPQPGFQIRAADINTDVKRDVNAGCIILAVLIGFCVLGIAMVSGNQQKPWGERTGLLLYAFAALDVLVSIAIIRGLFRWGISGDRTPSAERVLGIIFLSLGMIVAVTIFCFWSCGVLLR